METEARDLIKNPSLQKPYGNGIHRNIFISRETAERTEITKLRQHLPRQGESREPTSSKSSLSAVLRVERAVSLSPSLGPV